MKLKKTIRIAVFFLVTAFASNAAHAQLKNAQQLSDSASNDLRIREVLTSQQLFVVKLRPLKSKTKKNLVSFKAELRDAFKVILYKGDTSFTELDWSMFNKVSRPLAGTFKAGTAEYAMLDVKIEAAKKQKAELVKRVKTKTIDL